ncbi:hypothetical protein CMALT430_80021 [Carnobacterium maltaromaticum]|uniref:hypothetical protein n=1 Tax=Carnobacterium maltaromaticum TaxID=2751 RepID=UPI00191BB93B|nr:hypothetical protein [Carnobacterium maltaromaticum]CAD5902069.1 hypothetical protein CMALT430_80021 [Carnobacterium maltaromaticum]
MKIDRRCKTCEFNFNGICAGNEYDKRIVDENYVCSGWSISLDYFNEIRDKLPWFIQDQIGKGINFDKSLHIVDSDENGEEIEVNPIKTIKHIYGFKHGELATLFNVTNGVISSAENRGVPQKRRASFAAALNLPQDYMRKTTNLDFPDIEKYAKEFWEFNKRPKPTFTDFDSDERTRSVLQNEISDYLFSNGITRMEASLLLGRSEKYFESAILSPSRKKEVSKLSRVFNELKNAVEETKEKYKQNSNNNKLKELVEFRKCEKVQELNRKSCKKMN